MNSIVDFMTYPPVVIGCALLSLWHRHTSTYDQDEEGMQRLSKANRNYVRGNAMYSRLAYPVLGVASVVGAIGILLRALFD